MFKAIVGGALTALAWSTDASALDSPAERRAARRHTATTTDVLRPEVPPADPPRARDWYGWQIMVVDGSAIGLVLIGATTNGDASTALIAAGFGTYLIGGPIVHVANGEDDNSASSVGLRLGAPVAGFFLGGFVGKGMANDDGFGAAVATAAGAVIGFTVGVATAMTVDAAVVAKKDTQVDQPETAEVCIKPRLAVTPQGAFAGLTGTF